MSSRLRIGHVPEHFCAPLHIGAKRGVFKKHLVRVALYFFVLFFGGGVFLVDDLTVGATTKKKYHAGRR